jgi:hypothetical protein
MREYLARSRARRAFLSLLDPPEDPAANSGRSPAGAPPATAELP